MRNPLLLFTLIWFSLGACAAPKSKTAGYETRCGWFSNPTPSNAWLFDRDGEWTVSVQGGFQAEGDWPDFGAGEWVETNVHYGYGCACLKAAVDRPALKITRIVSARALPLAKCREDPALRRWGFQ
jgi:hypothetical protein